MCLAIPGEVVSNEKGLCMVSYPGNITNKALVGEFEVQIGDIVMVQMGVVVRKMSQEEYQQVVSAWQEAVEKNQR
jgi:hydrogenase assembly chaperone HypC/HupF